MAGAITCWDDADSKSTGRRILLCTVLVHSSFPLGPGEQPVKDLAEHAITPNAHHAAGCERRCLALSGLIAALRKGEPYKYTMERPNPTKIPKSHCKSLTKPFVYRPCPKPRDWGNYPPPNKFIRVLRLFWSLVRVQTYPSYFVRSASLAKWSLAWSLCRVTMETNESEMRLPSVPLPSDIWAEAKMSYMSKNIGYFW